MTAPAPDDPKRARKSTRLTTIRTTRGAVPLAIMGAVTSAAGLLLLTMFASSPWLYLLYPVLIGVLIGSIGVLAISLLKRL